MVIAEDNVGSLAAKLYTVVSLLNCVDAMQSELLIFEMCRCGWKKS